MPAITKYQATIADAATGRPVAQAAIAVTDYPSGVPSTIYDAAGEVSLAAIATNSLGLCSFYVVPGRYNISVAHGFVSVDLTDVTIGAGGANSYPDINGSGKSAAITAFYDGIDDNGEDMWYLKASTI